MLGIALTLILGAEPPAGTFVVHAAKGEPRIGAVANLHKDWSVTLQGAADSTSGSDLVCLRQQNAKLPAPPAGAQAIFANGDRLPGKVVRVADGKVAFRAQLGSGSAARSDASECTIPLNMLAVLWLVSPPETLSPAVQRMLQERRRRDVVLLNNGDQLQGTLEALAADGKLRIKDADATREVEASHVIAVALNTDLARTPKPRGPYARLVLRNGARLALVSATGDEKSLHGRTLFAADVQPLWNQIVSLDMLQGPAMYLSDLKPKSYSHTPFLGVSWPYAFDRSVAGAELRVGGHCFDKGVGMHSESRISFALDAKYRRFETTVGLDDRTGQGGSVKIRVLVDGSEKAGGDELTPANGPRSLNIDVAGAKELTLVVEFGSGGDVHDHVNWADARLIK